MKNRSYSRLIISFCLNLLAITITIRREKWMVWIDPSLLTEYGPQLAHLLYSVLYLLWAHLFNSLLKTFFWTSPKVKVPVLLQDVMGILVYVFAIAWIVGFVLNFSTINFWTSTGAIGIVIGVALRNVILDAFMGLAFSLESEFLIGDFIVIHDRTTQTRDNIIGQVSGTNWRSTRLIMDGRQITVPNSVIGSKVITNLSRPNVESEFELVFAIDFSVDAEHVLRVLTAGAKAVTGIKGILDHPEPKARIKGTNELGVEYKVKYTILPTQIGPGKARHFIMKSILEHLNRAGISLAYPKLDSYYARMPHRQLDLNSIDDRRKILSRVSLFQTLQHNTLNQLASLMILKHYGAGDTLIHQNEAGDSMYILLEGLLDAYIDKDSHGQLIKAGQILPGQFFGEMSLLTGEKRSATIQASTSAEVYEITREHVETILMQHIKIAEKLSMSAAENRVRNSATLKKLSDQEQSIHAQNAATQILEKMKTFFNSLY